MSNKVVEALQKALELMKTTDNNDLVNTLQAMHDFSLTDEVQALLNKELDNDPLLVEAIKTIGKAHSKDKQ